MNTPSPSQAKCHCGRNLKPFGKYEMKCPVGHIKPSTVNPSFSECKDFTMTL